MPEVLVMGGSSSLDGLAATLMRMLQPDGQQPDAGEPRDLDEQMRVVGAALQAIEDPEA